MRTVSLLVLAAALAGCKTRQTIPVDTTEAKDIPREIAIGKLRDLLPTAETVYWMSPRDKLSASEIKDWSIGTESIEVRPRKGKPYTLAYADITQSRLDQSGKYFLVKVFTTTPDREQVQFIWRSTETPTQVVELLEAVRGRR